MRKKLLLLCIAAALMVLAAACDDKDKEPDVPEIKEYLYTINFTVKDYATMLTATEIDSLKRAGYNKFNAQLTGTDGSTFKTKEEFIAFADYLINAKAQFGINFVPGGVLDVANHVYDATAVAKLQGMISVNQMPEPGLTAEEIAAIRARIAELEAMEKVIVGGYSWRGRIGNALSRTSTTQPGIMVPLYYQVYFPEIKEHIFETLEGNLAEGVFRHINAIDDFVSKNSSTYFYLCTALRDVRNGIMTQYMNEIGNEWLELYAKIKFVE